MYLMLGSRLPFYRLSRINPQFIQPFPIEGDGLSGPPLCLPISPPGQLVSLIFHSSHLLLQDRLLITFDVYYYTLHKPSINLRQISLFFRNLYFYLSMYLWIERKPYRNNDTFQRRFSPPFIAWCMKFCLTKKPSLYIFSPSCYRNIFCPFSKDISIFLRTGYTFRFKRMTFE